MWAVPGAAVTVFLLTQLRSFNGIRDNVPEPVWLTFLILVPLITAYIGGRMTILATRPKTGPGFCSKCDYNLRGNVSGVCPECGTPLDGRRQTKNE